MGDITGISWTDATWNPVRGCSRVSAGCVHCYAEVQAARIVRMGKGKPTAYDGLVKLTAAGEPRWTGEVRLVPEQLAWPLRKRKPLRVFVNSMSDLFHERLRDEDIAAVFAVMALAAQHTYQILTKRPARMREFFERWSLERCIEALARHEHGNMVPGGRSHNAPPRREWYGVESFPLPWVWLGVSAEDQAAADERIPDLLRTPAAVRFLSCEPLIGPVSLALPRTWLVGATARKILRDNHAQGPVPQHLRPPPSLDWIIAGCESGPGARPCSVEWLSSLRDQCASAGVAFFLKQAVEDSGMRPDDLCDECGERERWHVHGPSNTSIWCGCTHEGPEDANWHPLVGFGEGSKRKPGGVIELPYLDGVQHAAFPDIADA